MMDIDRLIIASAHLPEDKAENYPKKLRKLVFDAKAHCEAALIWKKMEADELEYLASIDLDILNTGTQHPSEMQL